MKVKSIKRHAYEEHTYDVTTPSHTYLLPNGVVSHNSSVVLNSTNGIEMPYEFISVKESKGGLLVQVVPEYKKLKNRYQLIWDQTDCIGYLKTASVIAAYVDQSISTNTFYNPAHFEGNKIPATLISKNLMLGIKWGLKTFYYSLMNKVGAKEGLKDAVVSETTVQDSGSSDEYCEACVL